MFSPPSFPADCFALILGNLGRVIAARIIQRPADQPVLLLLWAYLQRRIRQFTTLAERVRGNRVRPPRAAVSPAAPKRAPRARGARLPSRFAWVAVLVPGSAAYGSQLVALLAAPEMKALLEAAPQAGRIVRPLLRMLGAVIPPDLSLGPRASRPPLAAATTAPAVQPSPALSAPLPAPRPAPQPPPGPAAPRSPIRKPPCSRKRLASGEMRLGSFVILVPG